MFDPAINDLEGSSSGGDYDLVTISRTKDVGQQPRHHQHHHNHRQHQPQRHLSPTSEESILEERLVNTRNTATKRNKQRINGRSRNGM